MCYSTTRIPDYADILESRTTDVDLLRWYLCYLGSPHQPCSGALKDLRLRVGPGLYHGPLCFGLSVYDLFPCVHRQRVHPRHCTASLLDHKAGLRALRSVSGVSPGIWQLVVDDRSLLWSEAFGRLVNQQHKKSSRTPESYRIYDRHGVAQSRM